MSSPLIGYTPEVERALRLSRDRICDLREERNKYKGRVTRLENVIKDYDAGTIDWGAVLKVLES